ncbi:hypothetical protein FB451DRAFT_1557396 [Mycena latifolia]|nr:hypothetical protein FB451DRAFT_1557396 [Mycena latifolia]
MRVSNPRRRWRDFPVRRLRLYPSVAKFFKVSAVFPGDRPLLAHYQRARYTAYARPNARRFLRALQRNGPIARPVLFDVVHTLRSESLYRRGASSCIAFRAESSALNAHHTQSSPSNPIVAARIPADSTAEQVAAPPSVISAPVWTPAAISLLSECYSRARFGQNPSYRAGSAPPGLGALTAWGGSDGYGAPWDAPRSEPGGRERRWSLCSWDVPMPTLADTLAPAAHTSTALPAPAVAAPALTAVDTIALAPAPASLGIIRAFRSPVKPPQGKAKAPATAPRPAPATATAPPAIARPRRPRVTPARYTQPEDG